MITPQLVDFIKQQLGQGITREKISTELLANGWSTEDVKEGFEATMVPSSTPAPTLTPVSNFSPTDVKPVATVKTVSHFNISLKNIIIFVLIFFLLAGGVSAYYFKDEIIKLPVIKDFFPQEEIIDVVVPEVPLNNDNTQQDATAQTDNQNSDTITPADDDDLNALEQDVSGTDTIIDVDVNTIK